MLCEFFATYLIVSCFLLYAGKHSVKQRIHERPSSAGTARPLFFTRRCIVFPRCLRAISASSGGVQSALPSPNRPRNNGPASKRRPVSEECRCRWGCNCCRRGAPYGQQLPRVQPWQYVLGGSGHSLSNTG
ncbi:Hypothetical protein, putative, partial [Bodo saltans]